MMSKMTDIDHAISSHAKWLREEIKFPTKDEDITVGRQELLDAVKSSDDGTTLADYLDKKLGVERVVTSTLPILSLPESLSWENMAIADNKQTITDYWDSLDCTPNNWLASLPVYWTAVHYKAIVENSIHGNIKQYFESRAQSTVEASTLVIHRLGSAPQRDGYSAPMRHCHIGRTWWERRTAKKVAVAENCELSESRAYEIIQQHPAFYNQVLAMSIANLTTLNSTEMLAALFSIADDISNNKIEGIKISFLNNQAFIRKWIREIGKTFYGRIPEYMEWQAVLNEVESSLRKAMSQK